MVGRLGLLVDLVGEATAAHRLVLFEDGAEVRQELAEFLDDLGGSLLVLLGDDQEDQVVETLRGFGHESSLRIAGQAREARPVGRAKGLIQPAGTISDGRLKRFMAASIPSVTKVSIASQAVPRTGASAARSGLEKRSRT